jgi:hypothetical protein
MTALDSCSHGWAEPHLGAVELAQLCVAEEDAVYVFVHLFESDLLVAEHFAYENAALVPTDVAAVIHSPRLERSWILKACHPAGEQPSAGYVDAPRRFVVQSFVGTPMVEYQAESIKLHPAAAETDPLYALKIFGDAHNRSKAVFGIFGCDETPGDETVAVHLWRGTRAKSGARKLLH